MTTHRFCDNTYICNEEGEMKMCGACRHTFYCSKACQKQHWRKHKPNCIPQQSSLHELFKACGQDLLPDPPAAADYGFDNMRLYHGNVLWGRSGIRAEQILLGLFQTIRREVSFSEDNGMASRVINSIGVSKKMILKAYENNSLDEFVHRFINNIFEQYKDRSFELANFYPDFYLQYCQGWLENRLVIGPTRLQGLTRDEEVKMRTDIYHRYYGHRAAVRGTMRFERVR